MERLTTLPDGGPVMAINADDATKLRASFEMVQKFTAMSGGKKPMSATYSAEMNDALLSLAMDGLRFNVLIAHSRCCADGDKCMTAAFKDERFREFVDYTAERL